MFDPHTIMFDPSKTRSQRIADGFYGKVHEWITEEHFPSAPTVPSQPYEMTIELLRVDQQMTTRLINERTVRFAHVPLTIDFLLALGEQYPEIQRNFPVVALGSGDRCDGNSRDRFPCLIARDGRRDLTWSGPTACWKEDVRFLVSRVDAPLC